MIGCGAPWRFKPLLGAVVLGSPTGHISRTAYWAIDTKLRTKISTAVNVDNLFRKVYPALVSHLIVPQVSSGLPLWQWQYGTTRLGESFCAIECACRRGLGCGRAMAGISRANLARERRHARNCNCGYLTHGHGQSPLSIECRLSTAYIGPDIPHSRLQPKSPMSQYILLRRLGNMP